MNALGTGAARTAPSQGPDRPGAQSPEPGLCSAAAVGREDEGYLGEFRRLGPLESPHAAFPRIAVGCERN